MAAISKYPNLGYSKVGYSVFAMNVEANKVCGQILARMRLESGLTQVDLARTLGVPQSFISKVETGERALRLYEQFDYARALGIEISSFALRLEAELDDAEAVGFKKS